MIITLSCGCKIDVKTDDIGVGFKDLCQFHVVKENRADILINFHNWYVEKIEGLRKVLSAL